MGVFKNFTTKGGKVGSSGGNYFKVEEGEEYVCEIEKVHFYEPRKGAPAFIAECLILECDKPDMVGKKRNFYQSTDQDWSVSNILEFTYAAHGVDPYDAEAIAAFEAANPIPGLKADESYWDKRIEEMCPKAQDGKASKNGGKIFVSCFLKLKKGKDKDSKDPKDYSGRTRFLPYVE